MLLLAEFPIPARHALLEHLMIGCDQQQTSVSTITAYVVVFMPQKVRLLRHKHQRSSLLVRSAPLAWTGEPGRCVSTDRPSLGRSFERTN